MTTTTGYKVVVLSDLHLGMKDCKPKKILKFLRSIHTDLLILNGDIIDIDALKRGNKWKKKYTNVLMEIMEISKQTEVIYIRGNHDDDVDHLYDFEFGNIKFVEEYYYNHRVWVEHDLWKDERILIFHGDKIDATTKWKFLTQIGSVGYDISLRMNTWYNKYRMKMGKPYFSISKIIKENFKKALTFISDFETNACEYAKTKGCDSVICGHIHIPTMKKIDGVFYYNSGDWVENFSALVLTKENKWELMKFEDHETELGG
jgi:UDP-2,3-diacylglucosamine pyrophosphatase LpxH